MKRLAVVVTAGAAVLGLAGCGPAERPWALSPTGVTSESTTAPPTTSSTSETRSSSFTPSTSSERTSALPTPDGDVRNDPLLGGNPVTLEQGVGVGQVDCQLPGWRNNPDANQAYYQAAIGCLDNAWRPTLSHFGETLESPRLWAGANAQTYDGACASGERNREAFYCGQDQTIVMPFDTMNSLTGSANGAGAAFAVISHEYGHHLQQQTRVLAQYSAQRTAAGWDSGPGLQMSRQLELQAWCFSGMFFGVNLGRGSISQDLWRKAANNNSGAGDRRGEARQHGTNQNVSNWFGWGFSPTLDRNQRPAPSTYECNPWAARDNGWIQ
ncbi:neutral zinc metallopeptidase [Actinocrispum wychmicini]|uniref:Metalloprotease n=1 Tax=Actinocrispum wychmicini TaxID=1213861 RepID=A0A4R2JLL5_9PSEU|nr:neutral zinc metallopeptidase [Actinocrispum wychmicini]TCO60931.1 hypothetical protein EV192_103513 [Actinocrispum wychmicini]